MSDVLRELCKCTHSRYEIHMQEVFIEDCGTDPCAQCRKYKALASAAKVTK